MSKHYFVTGITGFAAPHLAQLLLREGHQVSALIRGSNGREMDLLDILTPEEIGAINWKYGDLTSYNTLRQVFSEGRFDGLFHLAAQSHPPTSFANPLHTFEANVMGTANLIEAVRETQKDCPFMFCSTSEVYGDAGKDVGVLREDLPLTPSNPYGTSKAAIDLYMQERCRNGYLKGFITRAFSHTGPRRGHNFSISCDAWHLAMMAAGKEEKVLPVGNLKTQRIVVDVRDMVRAYYLLMQNHENGEAYNICGPSENVKEMGFFTDTLIRMSGLEGVEKRVDPRYYRPIDIQIQIGDTSKLQRMVDWKPEIAIEQTLSDLLAYWKAKVGT